MNDQGLFHRLEEIGAVLTGGHFVYQSGLHGSSYVNWARVLNEPEVSDKVDQLLVGLASRFDFETVVGPTDTGGLLATRLSSEFYRANRLVHSVYATQDAESKKRLIKREQEPYLIGKRVLVIDDVLTTGDTLDYTTEVVTSYGGRVVAYLICCNRNSDFTDSYNGVPLVSLLQVEMETWLPPCPHCEQNVPFTQTLGHGSSR